MFLNSSAIPDERGARVNTSFGNIAFILAAMTTPKKLSLTGAKWSPLELHSHRATVKFNKSSHWMNWSGKVAKSPMDRQISKKFSDDEATQRMNLIGLVLLAKDGTPFNCRCRWRFWFGLGWHRQVSLIDFFYLTINSVQLTIYSNFRFHFFNSFQLE